ncbi:3-hydroxyacyl-CoA dehydrogenase [Bradyrhizobium macuxiense]|uniref:3-hydroxyacyl-CoA dehydrogenase n=1 Tax=Bradyrhizobium macuxiense TaxID=1755647 RepID=A0A109JGN0_9BRAD|nr:3-hydroxyacyl-CoA dehydrogenase NAD-binding domain-containing protein [Bradyrhizobium macuxiense]KWV48489.1 3-hydroxyacyl-CoA dehydrogenase [Bradyrhizobium macuxiense]
MTQAIQTVAIIGTGVIGASWATAFLARGMDVIAADPATGAEKELRRTVAAQWVVMEQIGLSPDASLDRLRFVESLEDAVAAADFVQESGPERLDVKRDLFRRLDEAAPAESLIATSASTITIGEFQDACGRHPERVVLGHPFNPPHLIPLVEVGGGKLTSEGAIERALAFYRAMRKHPIRLRRESKGHVANRLQAALWQEAFHLVSSGVASVADVDAAIAHGPGLRWSLLGPFLNLHLSGGKDGIGALFEKPLWQATEGMWRDLGSLSVDGDLGNRVMAGVADEIGARDLVEMVRQRDDALVRLLRLKAASEGLP